VLVVTSLVIVMVVVVVFNNGCGRRCPCSDEHNPTLCGSRAFRRCVGRWRPVDIGNAPRKEESAVQIVALCCNVVGVSGCIGGCWCGERCGN
jgi:hypothetical protein